MTRRPPRSTRTDTLFPYTTLVRSGREQAIAPLSAAHDSIAPLRVTPHQWTNRLGYRSTGFIVWPRNYQTSSRYPARSEEHTSELQSLMRTSYAVFCLKKNKLVPTTIRGHGILRLMALRISRR